MLSEFETKQIGDWLSDIENVRSLSSEEQMGLAQANKERNLRRAAAAGRSLPDSEKHRNGRDDETAENYIPF